jgi:hypothetical protein
MTLVIELVVEVIRFIRNLVVVMIGFLNSTILKQQLIKELLTIVPLLIKIMSKMLLKIL